MKYIDADRLKAEIEKRMHICDGVFERDSDTYYQGKAVAYQETLSLIDSLPEEKPSEDLEEAVKRYYSDNFAYISSDQPTLSILTNIARHFAKWGAEHLRDSTKMIDIEDIEKIHTFLYAIKNNKQGVFTFTRLSDEQYKEVLRRFKAIKEDEK